MELSTLRHLSTADQQNFLLGRIVSETARMDIGLRFLHGVLQGRTETDAYLDAPHGFQATARECTDAVANRSDLEPRETDALLSAITAGREVYERRNRYMHDMLRQDLLDKSWELARMSRPRVGEYELVSVSFDEMVELVQDLVLAGWRLRVGGMRLLGNGAWGGLLFGAAEGHWDGSVSWIH